MNEHPIGTVLEAQKACQTRVWMHSVGIINTIATLIRLVAGTGRRMARAALGVGVITTGFDGLRDIVNEMTHLC